MSQPALPDTDAVPPLRLAGPPRAVRRPVLPPAYRRLWRDPQTLQLGRAPATAVVLSGLDPATRGTLALLDGTRDLAQVLRDAQLLGCSGDRALELLRVLDEADLLDDAAAPGAPVRRAEQQRLAPDHASLRLVGSARSATTRARASVQVVGASRVGAAVASLLTAAGVERVEVVDAVATRPEDTAAGGLGRTDVGSRRDAAAVERAGQLGDAASVGPGAATDLVVLAPPTPGGLDDAVAGLPAGAAHLVAEVRDAVGVVGPLVLPGRTACVRCLDLHRSDRDPAWPVLAAQLAGPWRGTPACDGTLAVAVAAQSCLQALLALDALHSEAELPATADGTLELALPDWRWRRRSWSRHPDCGCC